MTLKLKPIKIISDYQFDQTQCMRKRCVKLQFTYISSEIAWLNEAAFALNQNEAYITLSESVTG